MTDTNRQIEAMKKLGMSEAEIAEVLEADKRIDKGEKLFELTAEQEREAKKARNVGRAPTAYKFTKRERKPDEDKKVLCQTMIEAPNFENVIIEKDQWGSLKTSGTYEFQQLPLLEHNGKKYKVVLSAPRS